ncbi:hypothetical protein [Kitasatospora sp. NPDC008115]|uniref:hypothetical protein n=1 Tax=Kitasatospora sp. NPDC008115 TaxID=3364022 RepID=UPI0036E4EAFB
MADKGAAGRARGLIGGNRQRGAGSPAAHRTSGHQGGPSGPDGGNRQRTHLTGNLPSHGSPARQGGPGGLADEDGRQPNSTAAVRDEAARRPTPAHNAEPPCLRSRSRSRQQLGGTAGVPAERPPHSTADENGRRPDGTAGVPDEPAE